MMESKINFAKIKSLSKRVITFLTSKNVITFLLFLLLAFLLWFLHGTGSNRDVRGVVPIKYVGIPNNVKFDNSLPLDLQFVLRDEGSILWSYYFIEFDSLVVDLSESFEDDGHFVNIDYASFISQLKSQVSGSTQLVDIQPTIYSSDYSMLNSKIVPILFGGNISFSPQIVLVDSINVVPNFTLICGTEQQLDSVSALYVTPELKNISKSSELQCVVDNPYNILIRDTIVSLYVPVEMSTEKQLSIPIDIINLPPDFQLRTFPSEVDVKFSVGLSHYQNINVEDFHVVFDYFDVQNSTAKTTNKLKIIAQPDYIHNIRLTLDEVEYVIEQ